jgi:hypothetical protein
MIEQRDIHNLSSKTLTADNARPLDRIASEILFLDSQIFLDILISATVIPDSRDMLALPHLL